MKTISPDSPMLINYVSRVLYPNREQWQQRRTIKTTLYTLLVAVAFAGIVGSLIYFRNQHS